MRFLLLIILPFFGCGASEESVQEDWVEYVSSHNTCENADQCVAVYPGCPLGCASAVSKNAEADAIEQAESLISSFEKGGVHCDYNCLPNQALVCVDKNCKFQDGEL